MEFSTSTTITTSMTIFVGETWTVKSSGVILTINPGVIITINPGATIIVENGSRIDNSGTIINNGNIIADGTITNRSVGTIFNHNTITELGDIDNSGTINNFGYIDNMGRIDNQFGGNINNSGDIDNKNLIVNRAGSLINNSGNIYACGGTIIGIVPTSGNEIIDGCRPVPTLVGGEIIPIETTALLLAVAQSFSWMIPVVLSVLGIGLFVVSRKNFKNRN